MQHEQIYVLASLLLGQKKGYEDLVTFVTDEDTFSSTLDELHNAGYIDGCHLRPKGYNAIQTSPGNLSAKQLGIRINVYLNYLANKGDFTNFLCLSEDLQRKIAEVLIHNLARLEDQNRYSLLEEFHETAPVEEIPTVEAPVEMIDLRKKSKKNA